MAHSVNFVTFRANDLKASKASSLLANSNIENIHACYLGLRVFITVIGPKHDKNKSEVRVAFYEIMQDDLMPNVHPVLCVIVKETRSIPLIMELLCEVRVLLKCPASRFRVIKVNVQNASHDKYKCECCDIPVFHGPSTNPLIKKNLEDMMRDQKAPWTLPYGFKIKKNEKEILAFIKSLSELADAKIDIGEARDINFDNKYVTLIPVSSNKKDGYEVKVFIPGAPSFCITGLDNDAQKDYYFAIKEISLREERSLLMSTFATKVIEQYGKNITSINRHVFHGLSNSNTLANEIFTSDYVCLTHHADLHMWLKKPITADALLICSKSENPSQIGSYLPLVAGITSENDIINWLKNSGNLKEECAICYEKVTTRYRACGQCFGVTCFDCYKKWCLVNKKKPFSCPSCRKVMDYNIDVAI